MKKIKNLLVICFMTFLLTGCVKYNATMDIKKDKSMDFSIIYAFNSQLFGDQEILDDDEIKDLEENGFSVTEYNENNMKGFTIAKSIKNIDTVSSKEDTEYSLSGILEDNESYIFKVEKGLLKNKYIAKFNFDASDSDLSTDEDDEYTDESDDDYDSDYDYSSLMTNLDLSFNVTLPYSAISNNASTTNDDNKSLSWNLSSNEVDTIEFEFELYNMTNIYIGIGVIVLLLVVIVLLVILKNKKNKSNSVSHVEILEDNSSEFQNNTTIQNL
jgi:hypothetical protein